MIRLAVSEDKRQEFARIIRQIQARCAPDLIENTLICEFYSDAGNLIGKINAGSHYDAVLYGWDTPDNCGSTGFCDLIQSLIESRIQPDPDFIVRAADKTIINVAIKDIIYLEYAAKKILLHTANGSFNMISRTHLSDIELYLSKHGFIKPYRSIIVNIREIKLIQTFDLVLNSGDRLPVSRKYRQQVIQAMKDEKSTWRL